MLVKTVLNSLEKFKSFVYGKCLWKEISGEKALVIDVSARKSSKGRCISCNKSYPTYDTQAKRYYQYVPLWGGNVYFRYAPRRVNCDIHGIHVERVPWAEGKEHLTKSYQLFLATWAKRLSWKETADVFRTSWESVYRSICWVVEYGLSHRQWDNVQQIGVDETSVFKGHRYLTCVYKLDKGFRRLLWCGKDRKAKTLLKFFREFGKDRCAQLRFVCSDMWAPYLKVIKKNVLMR